MKKSRIFLAGLLILLVATLVAVLLPTGCAAPAPAPPTPTAPSPAPAPTAEFVWRSQDAFGPTSMSNYALNKLFSSLVNERSKGRIKIEHYDSGAIVGPFDIFGAVSKRTVEVATNCGAYYRTKIPEGDIEYGLAYDGLPIHLYHELVYEYKDGAYTKVLREVYEEHGIHHLTLAPVTSYGFMTTFPFRKVEDLKGKKIRTSGTVTMELLKQSGATPVSLPSVDVYMALQRGTIDGVTLGYYLLKAYKWAEVVNYVTLPDSYSAAALNLLMNLEVYNELPDDLKKLVDDTAEEVAYDIYMYGLKGLSSSSLDWAKENYGLEVLTLPDEEVAKIQDIVQPVYKQILKTPRCEQLYDIRESFMKEKGLW